VPVDPALALRQWDDYVEALRSAGWEPVEAPSADDCPDGVFVEDVLVAYEGVAVVTRPGAETRRAELAGIGDAVAALGYAVDRIVAHVLPLGGNRVLLAADCPATAELLADLGFEPVAVTSASSRSSRAA
jgi:N-dimethylarginine dimethylaminohydrolase